MTKKKNVSRKFESEVIGMPSLKMVLGEVPVPDPTKEKIVLIQNWQGKSKAVLQLIDYLDKKK